MAAKSRLDKPLPWYPWDPLQWQANRRAQRMGWAEKGFYRDLLDECYLKGSIPASLDGIASVLDCDTDEIAGLWTQVSRGFSPHPTAPDRLVSPLMEEIRAEQMAVRKQKAENRRGGKASGGESTPEPQESPSFSFVDGRSPEITDDHGSDSNATPVNGGTQTYSSTVQDSTLQKSTFLPPPAEAEGITESPAAAAASVPDWLLERLGAIGIQGSSARSLHAQLGTPGLQAALIKIRSKKGEKNPAGLLVRCGPELAMEGRAILDQQLGRALKLAPNALQDPVWSGFPAVLQDDLEVQAAWCAWKAAQSGTHAAGEQTKSEASRSEQQALGILLDLLEARHPNRKAILERAHPIAGMSPLRTRCLRIAAFMPVPDVAVAGGVS